MGKYTKVMISASLPSLPVIDDEEGGDPKFYEKVRAERERLVKEDNEGREFTSVQLAKLWTAAKGSVETLDKQKKRINLTLRALEQMMSESYVREGVELITLDDGSPVRRQPEPVGQVTNREEFRDWCLKDEDLRRQMTLPWQTMNKMAKDALLNGETPPPGVTLYVRNDKFVRR